MTVSSPKSEQSQSVTAHEASAATRRREKRRSQPSVDLKDPFQVLSLAIKVDETLGGQDWLKEPLEQEARLYSQSPEFTKAMAYLVDYSTNQKRRKPRRPLTPIILSGLIAAAATSSQESPPLKRDNNNNNKGEEAPVSATELTVSCNALRQQALKRVRRQTQRGWFRNVTVGVGVLGIILGAHFHALSRVETALLELGYLQTNQESSLLLPCESFQQYQEACRAAESRLWSFSKDYAMPHSSSLRDCRATRCNRESKSIIKHQLSNLPGRAQDFKYGQAPYALHTVISLDDNLLTTKDDKSTSRPFVEDEEDSVFHKELGWLGDSIVNRLVRSRLLEAIRRNSKNKSYRVSTKPLRVLDVGFGGFASALYALLPDEKSTIQRLDYTGIAIAPAEVVQARLLAAEHGIDNATARFQQMDFDDLGDFSLKFTNIIAVESLSFSRDIKVTLKSLAKAMPPGGSLIIVDDVVNSRVSSDPAWKQEQQDRIRALSNMTARTSLLSNEEWFRALKEAGFHVFEAVDIGVQYRLPNLVTEEQGVSFPYLVSIHLLRTFLARGIERLESWIPAFVRPGLPFLQRWEDWRRGDKGLTDTSAAVRTIQLIHEDLKGTRGARLRKEAHERVDLTYNLYVCTRL